MSLSNVGNIRPRSILGRKSVAKTPVVQQSDSARVVHTTGQESTRPLPSGYRLSSPELKFEIPSDGQAILGRGPDSDYPVKDRLVSSTHAVFQMHEGKIQILDPGSTNGTIVNGKKLPQKEWQNLEPGSVLRMGTLQFTLRGPNDKAVAPPTRELREQTTKSAAQAAQGALPGLSGLALKDLKSGRMFPLKSEGGNALGRASHNDVVLEDLKVSRQHANLTFNEGTLFLWDHASTRGTSVNGEALQAKTWKPVKAGDKLTFGENDFRLVSTPRVNLESKQELEKIVDFRELVTDPKKQQKKFGQLVPDEPNAYWQNNAEARLVFDDYVNQGDFSNGKAFKSMLKKSHRLAVEGSDGERRYYKKSGAPLGEDQLPGGEFHPGVMGGIRNEESAQVEKLAQKYGDPYRLESDQPSQAVQFPGIESKDQPNNMVMLGGQRHIYPTPKAFDAYFDQMQNRLDKLEKLPPDAKDQKLQTIGEFYHYAANVRPFHNVNNSLFMNFTNSLLKRHGFKPVYHGLLDHAAHRLQPKAFNQYFKDWTQGEGQIR